MLNLGKKGNKGKQGSIREVRKIIDYLIYSLIVKLKNKSGE